MRSLTKFAILLCLASGSAAISSCASDANLSSREPGSDPFPWCADQRREAAERMPALTHATPEQLAERDGYLDAHVDLACQQATSPTHP